MSLCSFLREEPSFLAPLPNKSLLFSLVLTLRWWTLAFNMLPEARRVWNLLLWSNAISPSLGRSDLGINLRGCPFLGWLGTWLISTREYSKSAAFGSKHLAVSFALKSFQRTCFFTLCFCIFTHFLINKWWHGVISPVRLFSWRYIYLIFKPGNCISFFFFFNVHIHKTSESEDIVSFSPHCIS